MHISFVQNLKRTHISIKYGLQVHWQENYRKHRTAIKLFVYKYMFNFVLITLLYAL